MRLKDKKISKLEKLSAKIAGAIVGAECVLASNNFGGLHISASGNPERFRLLPIENSYFGDTPEIFTAVMASGLVADKIEEYGHKKGSKAIEYVGRNFPALTAATIGTYYTLGETILPQLLPGTADIKDVPAVAITALASPFIASYVRKKWPELKQKVCGIAKGLEVVK
jgi:hypothetical protein